MAIISQAIIFVFLYIVTGYNLDPKAIQTPLALWGKNYQASLIPSHYILIAFIVMYK
jgi:hypothetical protein